MPASYRFCLILLYTLLCVYLGAQPAPALIPYRLGDLWGYADSSGTITVSPQFAEASPFVHQLEMLSPYFDPQSFQASWPELRHPVALVKKDNLWGLLGANGQVLVPPVNREKIEFRKAGRDVFWVLCDMGGHATSQALPLKTALLSGDGRMLTPFIYDFSNDYDEGDGWGDSDTYGHSSFIWGHSTESEYLAVYKGMQQGMLSVQGKEVIPPVWNSVIPLENGVALATCYDSLPLEGCSGPGQYLVAPGNRIIRKLDPDTYWQGHCRQGLFSIQQQGLIGFMNTAGELVIPFAYQEYYGFTDDGLAKVRTPDGRWSIINTKNETVFALGPNGGCWKHPDGYFIQENDGLWYHYDLQFHKTGTIDFQNPPYRVEIRGQQYYQGQAGDHRGLVDPSGQVVLPFEYDNSNSFQYQATLSDSRGIEFLFNGFYVQKNGKTGVLDSLFRVVIPCEFEGLSLLYGPDLYQIQEDGKRGIYSLHQKKQILPAVFDEIRLYEQPELFYSVRQGNYWGKYGLDGHELFPVIYEEDCFQANYSAPKLVKSQRGWHIFNPGGREIAAFGPVFGGNASVSWFNEGGQRFMAIRAEVKGKPALFDLQGKQLIPADFDYFHLHHDLLFARKGDKEGVLTYPGFRELIPFQYKNIGFDEGKFRLYTAGVPGFEWYDPETGKRTKINSTYSGIQGFSEGLAVAQRNCIFGFVDENFREVVALQFAYAYPFSEGLAAVKTVEGRWGYLNRNGAFALAPLYLRAEAFRNGVAIVELQHLPDTAKWQALIDRNGREVYAVKAEEGAGIYRAGPFLIAAESYANSVVLDSIGQPVLNGCSCLNQDSYRPVIRYFCQGEAGELSFDGSKHPAGRQLERVQYRNGLTGIRYCQAWGLQDSAGRWIIPMRGQSNGNPVDGSEYFTVWQNDKAGLYNSAGQLLIPAEYEQITPLGNYWQAYQKELSGLFDRQGRMIVPVKYVQVEPLPALGLVKVTTSGNQTGFYDFKGRKYFVE